MRVWANATSVDALRELIASGHLPVGTALESARADLRARTDRAEAELERAGESVRAALEVLAAAYPAWLEQRICVPDWARRYGTPVTAWRPPVSQAKQDELAIAYARDGYALLEAVCDEPCPAWLRELPTVDVLCRVLVQNYTRTITGNGREVIKRREKEPER